MRTGSCVKADASSAPGAHPRRRPICAQVRLLSAESAGHLAQILAPGGQPTPLPALSEPTKGPRKLPFPASLCAGMRSLLCWWQGLPTQRPKQRVPQCTAILQAAHSKCAVQVLDSGAHGQCRLSQRVCLQCKQPHVHPCTQRRLTAGLQVPISFTCPACLRTGTDFASANMLPLLKCVPAEGLVLPGTDHWSAWQLLAPCSQGCHFALQPVLRRWEADPQGPSFDFGSLPAAYAATQNTAQLALPPDALQVCW